MKKIALLLLCVTLGTSVFAQNTARDKGKRISVFADFEQLGMSKELFVERYGLPVYKDMALDNTGGKTETLRYVEWLYTFGNAVMGGNSITVVTEFVFQNDRLTEMKSDIVNPAGMVDFQKISSDIATIKSKVD